MNDEIVGLYFTLDPERLGGLAGFLQGNVKHRGEELFIDPVELG